jgi:hypothetical protein
MVYWLRIARNIRVTPNRFDIKILTMWHSTHQRRIWQGTVPIEAYTTRRPASSRLAKRPRVPWNQGTDLKESPLKDVHFEGFKRDPEIIRHFLMFLFIKYLVFQWMDVTHLKPWFLLATRWLVHKLRFYKLGKLTARIHHLCQFWVVEKIYVFSWSVSFPFDCIAKHAAIHSVGASENGGVDQKNLWFMFIHFRYFHTGTLP